MGLSPRAAAIAAALSMALALSRATLAEPGAGSPADTNWGDRAFAADEGIASLRSETVESFDAEGGWTCAMSPDEGLATLRSLASPLASEALRGGRVLGLKVEFYRRAHASVLLTPRVPLSVDAPCVALSIRALGRNFSHELSLVALDYFGRAYVLPLGRLAFTGWKTLSAKVPRFDPATGRGLVQDDGHFTRDPGLRIVAIRIDFDPEEAYGSFYAYFDDLEARIETREGTRADVSPRSAAEIEPESPGSSPASASENAPPAARPSEEKGNADRGSDAGARALSEISAKIAAAMSYPAAARRRGLEGTLVAAFVVDEAGALASASVSRSSGSDILDRAGLDLLKSAFPVENDSMRRLELSISIGFKLTEAPPSP